MAAFVYFNYQTIQKTLVILTILEELQRLALNRGTFMKSNFGDITKVVIAITYFQISFLLHCYPL